MKNKADLKNIKKKDQKGADEKKSALKVASGVSPKSESKPIARKGEPQKQKATQARKALKKRSFSLKLVACTFIFALFSLVALATYVNPADIFGGGVASIITALADQQYVTVLDVPSYKQQYANTCEASSLRMALAYYGIKTDDMSIVLDLGYKPRVKDVADDEWDDPQQMFVGYADVLGSTTGYGVYGKPIVRAAEEFGRQAEYVQDVTPELLAQEVRAGHPVVIWGFSSLTAFPYTWNAPDGSIVKAVRGEHARVVVGVKGFTENPLGFYVNDPLTGKKDEYWTTSDLMLNIDAVPGVTNQAVVVR